MKKKNTYVRMDTRPSCDFCHREADYDGLTLRGMWGYMCKEHFSSIGVAYFRGLGLGIGQEIITVKEGKTCGEGDTD